MVKFNKVYLPVIIITFFCLTSWCDRFTLEECRQKAYEGAAEAQWQMGVRYENGDEVKKNALRAIAMYKKAAEQKHRQACEKLSKLYEEGKIVKKDAVLAAKYKAWSLGVDGESAASEARDREELKNVDEIEIALDYILGRSGKPKDPKTGIRILYSQAKDKPLAQRVFVDRWSKGDLDSGLEMLSNDEWLLIIPWFKDAWCRGNLKTGLVLGNNAYRQRDYRNAVVYWEKSGVAKALYFLGRFYDSWAKEGDGGGPTYMRDELKARRAYERCLKINDNYDDAKYSLGVLYLFPDKKENRKLVQARDIFSYFVLKNPDDKWVNWFLGYSGFCVEIETFDQNYPSHMIRKLQFWKEVYDIKDKRGNYRLSYDDHLMKEKYKKFCDDYEQMKRAKERYLEFIQKAARLGCESAQTFLKKNEK